MDKLKEDKDSMELKIKQTYEELAQAQMTKNEVKNKIKEQQQ